MLYQPLFISLTLILLLFPHSAFAIPHSPFAVPHSALQLPPPESYRTDFIRLNHTFNGYSTEISAIFTTDIDFDNVYEYILSTDNSIIIYNSNFTKIFTLGLPDGNANGIAVYQKGTFLRLFSVTNEYLYIIDIEHNRIVDKFSKNDLTIYTGDMTLLTVDDLDFDGNPEIIIGSSAGKLLLMEFTESGKLNILTSITTDYVIMKLITGKFTNTQSKDIAILNNGTNKSIVNIIRWNKESNSLFVSLSRTFDRADYGLEKIDTDNNKIDELLIGTVSGFYVLLQNGIYQYYTTYIGPLNFVIPVYSMVTGDIENNNVIDIIFTDYNSNIYIAELGSDMSFYVKYKSRNYSTLLGTKNKMIVIPNNEFNRQHILVVEDNTNTGKLFTLNRVIVTGFYCCRTEPLINVNLTLDIYYKVMSPIQKMNYSVYYTYGENTDLLNSSTVFNPPLDLSNRISLLFKPDKIGEYSFYVELEILKEIIISKLDVIVGIDLLVTVLLNNITVVENNVIQTSPTITEGAILPLEIIIYNNKSYPNEKIYVVVSTGIKNLSISKFTNLNTGATVTNYVLIDSTIFKTTGVHYLRISILKEKKDLRLIEVLNITFSIIVYPPALSPVDYAAIILPMVLVVIITPFVYRYILIKRKEWKLFRK